MSDKKNKDEALHVGTGIGAGILGGLALKRLGGRLGANLAFSKHIKNLGNGLSHFSMKGDKVTAVGDPAAAARAIHDVLSYSRTGRAIGGMAGVVGGGTAGYLGSKHLNKEASYNKYLEKIASILETAQVWPE